MRVLPFLNLALLLTSSLHAADEEKISYSQDVRPILSAKCFFCHGPDANKREADLRLDRPEAAFADRDGHFAIKPGDVEKSEVWKRISSDDEFTQMPPPESKRFLSAEEKQTLKTWIEQGAKYESHWAFQQPKQSDPPANEFPGWSDNPIDKFVYDRMERKGLFPNPEADRYTLVRRVYLDLIGLPPTVEQADQFVSDKDPDAYERLVEELLASPHYGERWARKWLDLARYSDTNGYEKDRPREMHIYRDWVIDAINQDMPFDRFTVEQIAGDMLPDATRDQIIATGFHRNTMVNEEGGVDPQEFRFHAMVDRVNTTGTTWLGLTVGCCQCHTHKYDPITQTEYYRMMAFLNNADEPRIDIHDEEIARQREAIEHKIEQAKQALATKYPLPTKAKGDSGESPDELRRQQLEIDFTAWLTEQREKMIDWKPLKPKAVLTNLPNSTVLDDLSVLISGDQTKKDIFTLDFEVDLDKITGIRLEAIPDPSLPFGGPGRSTINAGVEKGGEFFVSEIFFKAATSSEQKLEERNVEKTYHSFARGNRSAEFTIDRKSDTGWSIAPRMKERHTAVYRLKEPIEKQDGPVKLQVRIEHESFHPSGLGRFRIAVTDEEKEFAAFDRPERIEQLVATPDETLTESERDELREFYLMTTPKLKAEQDKIAKLKKSMPDLPTALVMDERPRQFPRETHRHHRGEFLNPREIVTPGVPEVLHAFPEDKEPNRLNFARWLVSEDNPLTARVVMNRTWEAFFGTGLVRTTEDFGMQGELPTHPELLDWLAVEFMNRGWSRKAMHRLIVTSQTYRQSAEASDEQQELDPENKWLSRMPRVRLEAEIVRDNSLAVSGLLSSEIGGPSVFPPQPPGITEAAYGPLQWQVSKGKDRYRRGLYTFNKRTAPYSMFSTFDAPSGEQCISRRDPSNTPLQALTTLNSEVFVEAAQNLALEILRSDSVNDTERMEKMFRKVLIRPVSFEEAIELSGFVEETRAIIDKTSAHRIVGAGQLKRWDFDPTAEGWEAAHQAKTELANGHLKIISEGNDPFLRADLFELNVSGTLTIVVRANFPKEGKAQFFWTTETEPNEDGSRSATFDAKAGWHEYEVRISPTQRLKSLRFDPPPGEATTELDWMTLSVGGRSRPVPEGIDVKQWAVWTTLARAILNLDETITRP